MNGLVSHGLLAVCVLVSWGCVNSFKLLQKRDFSQAPLSSQSFAEVDTTSVEWEEIHTSPSKNTFYMPKGFQSNGDMKFTCEISCSPITHPSTTTTSTSHTTHTTHATHTTHTTHSTHTTQTTAAPTATTASTATTGAGTGPHVKYSELKAREAELTSDPFMVAVKNSVKVLDLTSIEAIEPKRPENPANVKRVESIISSEAFDELFSRRAPEYTYSNFLKGVGAFPAFCGDYADGRDAGAICRKALATMFAHFAQETGEHDPHSDLPEWKQALHHVREMGLTEGVPGSYGNCEPEAGWISATWPCGKFPEGHPHAGKFKNYFGRGAKQLSYNFNYGPFSQIIYGNVDYLLQNPELVADTWLNFASAVFFYVYPQPPKPSMLFVVDGEWQPNEYDLQNGLKKGFGVTTQIINGGVECGGQQEIAQSLNRIEYYKGFCSYLKVDIPADEVLGCANMKQFGESGAGALGIYWEDDWQEGPYCKLVSYQTPFTIYNEDDFVKCAEITKHAVVDYDA